MNMIPTIAPMPLPEYAPKPTIARMNHHEVDASPNENSTLESLVAYALLMQEGIYATDKKNAEDMWLMGQVLTWAFKKILHGNKEDWLESQGLKKTYAWQARQLFKATLEQVKQYGLTEALRKFKIVAEKKSKADVVPVPESESEENEISTAPSTRIKEGTEPTDQVVGEDLDPDGDAEPAADLANEETKEHKEYQAKIRMKTPKDRAVAIQHSLELLRDDLSGEDVDEELQQIFGQIAALAEEMIGRSKQNDLEQAA